MKLTLLAIASLCICSVAHAGGSITWEEVKSRISRTDPDLIKCIESNFTVNRGGGGTRLGNQFGDRVGERIPPYDFDAIQKNTGEKYHLEILESDDFEFTERYKFIWRIMPKK